MAVVSVAAAACGNAESAARPNPIPLQSTDTIGAAPSPLAQSTAIDPVANYQTLILNDAEQIVQATSGSCTDASSCALELTNLQTVISRFSNDIQTIEVPSCYAAANAQLRSALTNYNNLIPTLLSDISSSATVDDSTLHQVSSAQNKLDQAYTALADVNCAETLA